MKETVLSLVITFICILICILPVAAQESLSINDTVPASATASQWNKIASRLQIGGYGEAVMQRMFYSDSPTRYAYPDSYKDKSHGRADLPHVVFYLGYDFGRGWKMATEI